MAENAGMCNKRRAHLGTISHWWFDVFVICSCNSNFAQLILAARDDIINPAASFARPLRCFSRDETLRVLVKRSSLRASLRDTIPNGAPTLLHQSPRRITLPSRAILHLLRRHMSLFSRNYFCWVDGVTTRARGLSFTNVPFSPQRSTERGKKARISWHLFSL